VEAVRALLFLSLVGQVGYILGYLGTSSVTVKIKCR